MIPIGDENHTIRTPIVTYLLLMALALVWLLVQGGARRDLIEQHRSGAPHSVPIWSR